MTAAIPELRIIADAAHEPAFNMAADLHLLHTCARDGSVNLRLYQWSPPTITIGYSQNASDTLDLDAMSEAGVAWIRRPTGGRAVLHSGDLTYSFIFPRHVTELGATIAESYGLISRCLLRGLADTGIRCEAHDSGDDLRRVRRDVKLPCFLAPNRDEIMVRGKKLVGSAQKRTEHAVLQHGSIPLTPACRELPMYLRMESDQRSVHTRLLEAKSTCVQEIDPAIGPQRLMACLSAAFAAELPFTSREQTWTGNEFAKISQLAASPEFRAAWLAVRADDVFDKESSQ